MIFSWILVFTAIAFSSAKIDVAIIGGGIGGASSAYFLNKLKPEANIEVFEMDKVGGRLATVEYEGRFYELGGSIIHAKNLLMKQFVEQFGLEENKGCQEDFAIYNASKLLFKSSNYAFLNVMKLWWRYGGDLFRLDHYNKKIINSFTKLYEWEKLCNYPFNSTHELLKSTDHNLLSTLAVSTKEGLQSEEFSDIFINELVASIIRCNYCQSSSIHFFVGSVAIAGAGADLWSVKGGNWQVADHLLNASGATIIQDEVNYISTIEDSGKLLIATPTKLKMFDYAIIAAPLTEVNNIEFHGFEFNPLMIREKYHKTVCTLLKGEIREQFFGLPREHLPKVILFTDEFDFNAISQISPVDGDCSPEKKIWKIFSDKELTYNQLNLIFNSYRIIYIKDWFAYPEYKSFGENKSFFLFKNYSTVLHVNAIESLASAMEMSAIGGHNVASLIVKDIDKKNDKKFDNRPTSTTTVSPHDEF